MCPASVLQLHPHATVVVDEAAAAGLELADYYRDGVRRQAVVAAAVSAARLTSWYPVPADGGRDDAAAARQRRAERVLERVPAGLHDGRPARPGAPGASSSPRRRDTTCVAPPAGRLAPGRRVAARPGVRAPAGARQRRADGRVRGPRRRLDACRSDRPEDGTLRPGSAAPAPPAAGSVGPATDVGAAWPTARPGCGGCTRDDAAVLSAERRATRSRRRSTTTLGADEFAIARGRRAGRRPRAHRRRFQRAFATLARRRRAATPAGASRAVHDWRGLHVDLARQFFPAADVDWLIDVAAWRGFNRLHLHLTDDEAWRVPVDRPTPR